jgi:pimeloyl-ACP methyl ester carboxylesterase
MSYPRYLWLNTSPSLRCFEKPLLCYLSKRVSIARWEYLQTQDEASSLDIAIALLHDYLKNIPDTVHLIGHSTSGLLGLLYARQYPEKIASLTLLAVGADITIDWQVHYYTHLQALNRKKVLTTMAYNLFGCYDDRTMKKLANVLERDLDCSLSPHSLWQRVSLPPGGVSVPLMVCGSLDDPIVEATELHKWTPWLKASDRLYFHPDNGHFFHFFQPQQVGKNILNFWQHLCLLKQAMMAMDNGKAVST